MEARRILHGRGKTIAGLEDVVVDLYPPVYLISLYREVDDGTIDAVINDYCADATNIVLQRRYLKQAPAEIIRGEVPSPHIVEENGCKFLVDVFKNQNHGLFFDTANVRKYVRDYSVKGHLNVLNLFSYTCGFSLAALISGDNFVINMDMSKSAIKVGAKNHELNSISKDRYRNYPYEIFKSFSKVKKLGPYDLVIIDPPTFQMGSFDYKKDYEKLVKKIMPLIAPGGRMILCLNAPNESISFFTEMGERLHFKIIERINPVSDFKEVDPERALKSIVASVEE